MDVLLTKRWDRSKRQPFGEQHFQMHHIDNNGVNANLKFAYGRPVENKSAFVQVMAWRLFGTKPLAAP